MWKLARAALVVVILWALAGIVGTYASDRVRDAVESNLIRDIAISLIWVLALSLPWMALIALRGRQPLFVIGNANQPLVQNAGDLLPPPPPSREPTYDDFLATVTGDTLIRNVTDAWCPVEEVKSYEFCDLSLAQMALLRRISIRPAKSASQHECEEVLIAAGVNPSTCLVRMSGLGLFMPGSGGERRTLSQKSIDSVAQFSLWLTHDHRLVAAYRKVTFKIDSTIRFDGKTLLYDGSGPSKWVPPEPEEPSGC